MNNFLMMDCTDIGVSQNRERGIARHDYQFQ